MFYQVIHLMEQHILGAANTIPRDPCISIAEPKLVKMLRNNGVHVGGRIKHVRHLDLVILALGVALLTQLKNMSSFAAIIWCSAQPAWTLNTASAELAGVHELHTWCTCNTFHFHIQLRHLVINN